MSGFAKKERLKTKKTHTWHMEFDRSKRKMRDEVEGESEISL